MVDSTPGNPLGPNISGDEIVLTGEAHGDIMFRNASKWVVLPAGAAGSLLETQGAAADPIWAAQVVQMASGTYTGDGGLTQAITGIGFEPRYLEIWATITGEQSVKITFKNERMPDHENLRHESGAGGHKSLVNVATNVPGIDTLDADGFTVSDGNEDGPPNTNAVVYLFFCWG